MTTNTPDFIVYGVTQQAGKKDILTRIGGGLEAPEGRRHQSPDPGAAAEFRRKDRALPAEVRRSRRSAAQAEEAPF